MNITTASPSNSSLSALRGAVGEVVGVGDGVGGWDRLVWVWRVFWALDGLLALLWSIVERIASGEIVLEGVRAGEAVAMRGPLSDVAGSAVMRRVARGRTAPLRASRVRAVVPVCAVAGGRAVAGFDAASGWGLSSGGLVGAAPVLAVRVHHFSELAWDAGQSCVLIVPVC